MWLYFYISCHIFGGWKAATPVTCTDEKQGRGGNAIFPYQSCFLDISINVFVFNKDVNIHITVIQEGSRFPMHAYQIHFTTLSSSLSPEHCSNKPSITHLLTPPINLSNARKDDAIRPHNGPFMGCAMRLMQGKKEWVV